LSFDLPLTLIKISIFRSFGRLSVERNFSSVLAKGWLTIHSMRSPSSGIDLNSLIDDLREQRPQVLLRGPLGKVGGFELAPFYRINRSSRWRSADAYDVHQAVAQTVRPLAVRT